MDTVKNTSSIIASRINCMELICLKLTIKTNGAYNVFLQRKKTCYDMENWDHYNDKERTRFFLARVLFLYFLASLNFYSIIMQLSREDSSPRSSKAFYCWKNDQSRAS